MNSIPKASLGIIGGSTTWGAEFPEHFPELGITVLEYLPEQNTPFGKSAPLKLLRHGDHRILYAGMHGCFPNESEMIHPYWASKQLAWIYQQAKVIGVLGGGSVGGIQTSDGGRLPRWSVVIPDDFMMYPQVVVVPSGRIPRPKERSPFYRMANPFDAAFSRVLYDQAMAYNTDNLFPVVQSGGLYVCTPLGRFETDAEVRLVRTNGGTVVGQTVGYETIELRNVGISIASLNIVSNDAEGPNWDPNEPSGSMAEFYWECHPSMASVIASSAIRILNEGIKPTSLEQHMLDGLQDFPVKNA